MNTILSHYHQCETIIFSVTSAGHSGRITPKVAGSRRGANSLSFSKINKVINLLGSSKPFDDIREIELNDLSARYDLEIDTQSESMSTTEHRRFRLLSPPKKIKPKYNITI